MIRTFVKVTMYVVGGGVCLALLLGVSGWMYLQSFELELEPRADPASTASDLEFLAQPPTTQRGRILAVVTSVDRIGDSTKRTGYELTELSRAYWVFVANGYAVDIASPLGGEPRMVKDDDLGVADYAFLNDPAVQQQLKSTLKLSAVDPDDYAAVYFVGGKGTMWDFPGNADIQRIVRNIEPRGVIGAVCHGPAALVGLSLDDGRVLLAGRRVSAFTNAEERFLSTATVEALPFLLQDQLGSGGAQFVEGEMFLDHSVRDGNLVTGQNPWSTWSVAEKMIEALGHSPVQRMRTDEEISADLLAIYHRHGLQRALQAKDELPRSNKELFLMHAIVAGMQWQPGVAYDLQLLARHR